MADERQQDEAALADAYLDVATLGREVSALALQQALRDAKAGNLRDPGKTAVSAITASAIALDKRLVLQERPTQYIAIDPGEAVNALARKLGITHTIDATATEIPQPQIPAPTSITSPSAEPLPKTRASE